MKQRTTENPGPVTDSPIDGIVIVDDSPRGRIEIPQSVYDLIASDLSQCFQRGDDDRCSTPHLLGCPLRTETGGWVTLQTRNLLLILCLLKKHGVKYRLHSRSKAWPA